MSIDRVKQGVAFALVSLFKDPAKRDLNVGPQLRSAGSKVREE